MSTAPGTHCGNNHIYFFITYLKELKLTKEIERLKTEKIEHMEDLLRIKSMKEEQIYKVERLESELVQEKLVLGISLIRCLKNQLLMRL